MALGAGGVRTRPSGLHPPPQHSSPWQVTPHRDQAGDIQSQVREGRAVQGLGVPQTGCHQPGASRDPVVMPVPAAVMSESVAEAPGAGSPAALGETGTSHELLQRLRELEVCRNCGATRQPWPLKPWPPCSQCQEPAVASAMEPGHCGDGLRFPALHGPPVPLLLGQPHPAMCGPESHQETEGLLGATMSPELSLLCSRQRTQPWPRPMRTSGRHTNAAWMRYWRAATHEGHVCTRVCWATRLCVPCAPPQTSPLLPRLPTTWCRRCSIRRWVAGGQEGVRGLGGC